MAGSVYVIGAPDNSTVKIGVTNDLPRRLREIQYMSPVKLAVLWSSPGGPALEKALHAHFADVRSHGEWFTFDRDPIAAVRDAVESGLLPVPEESTLSAPARPERTEAPPFDSPGIFLSGLEVRFARGTRFTADDVAENCGYTLATVRSELPKLLEKGAVRRDRIRSSRMRQVYYLPPT